MRAEFLELAKCALRNSEIAVDERARMLTAARVSKEASGQVDRLIAAEFSRLQQGIESVRKEQENLRTSLGRASQPPFFPAVFLARAGETALMVATSGGGRRIVHPLAEVNLEDLRIGDELVLSSDQQLVVGMANGAGFKGGEIATFDRLCGSDRIVVRNRDDELVLHVDGRLRDELEPGCLVRFDRHLGLALEKMGQRNGDRFFLRATPKATFEDIGGLDSVVQELKRWVGLRVHHAAVSQRYGLEAAGTVLFVGPPGTGKTMLAGALANWLGQISGVGGARLIALSPGEWRSQWFGESEANIRNIFRAARQASDRDRAPCVLFFDELDSIGGARGRAGSAIDDRILQAFASELDGILGSRQNNCLVVGATNHRDLIDSALLRPGRFGDREFVVGRPGVSAARAILEKHLSPGLAYAGNGDGQEVRSKIIEIAVSRLYAPNGEPDLCTLVFRDGTRRPVRPAPDMMSGATLGNIARLARERAAWREIDGGVPGLDAPDILAAIDVELDRLARILTPSNVRDHLQDIPDDLDVVKIDRAGPRHARGRLQYLTLA